MAALRVEQDGDLLRVTLARPERRNAFDAGLIRELTEAFSDVGDARVVVLAGEGESFCAGADVDWQRASIDLSSRRTSRTRFASTRCSPHSTPARRP
jgi:enoyl-CoA hydratase/carnithine racemase